MRRRCYLIAKPKKLITFATVSVAIPSPVIKDLIGLMRKNKRAARAARTLEQFSAVLRKTTA